MSLQTSIRMTAAAEYKAEIDRARSEHAGARDQATWCPTCLKAWPGHVQPPEHKPHDEVHPFYEHYYSWLDFTPEPPADGVCRQCAEWRAFPPGQEHFGVGWFATCDIMECSCEHHKTEMWFA